MFFWKKKLNKKVQIYAYMMCPKDKIMYALEDSEWIGECVVCHISQREFLLVGAGHISRYPDKGKKIL